MKNVFLILASIFFITIIGGAVYEHVAVVPQWSAAPPASLSMFQGEYGVDAGPFWQTIHPITMLLLIAALAANWKNERRKFIATTLGTYVVILAVTAVYFVPELLSIVKTPFSETVIAELTARAKMWEMLSLVRLAVLFGLAGSLLVSLTKPVTSFLAATLPESVKFSKKSVQKQPVAVH